MSMDKLLKTLDAIEISENAARIVNENPLLTKSVTSECDMGSAVGAPAVAPKMPASLNMTAGSGQEIADMLRAIAALDQSGDTGGSKLVSTPTIPASPSTAPATSPTSSMADTLKMLDSFEEDDSMVDDAMYDNSPDEKIDSHDFGDEQVKPKPQGFKQRMGDNPYSLAEQLMAEFQEFVSEAKKKKGKKPDFLDMDKDGDKKEPMKKAIKDKKKIPPKKK